MSGIMMPQKKPGMMQQVLPLAGTLVGGMVGGPAGAAVGGTLGGMASQENPGPAPIQSQAQPVPVAQSTPMQRRMDSQGGAQPDQLAQADQALTQLPPEYQQQYGPMIRRARMNGGMA